MRHESSSSGLLLHSSDLVRIFFHSLPPSLLHSLSPARALSRFRLSARRAATHRGDAVVVAAAVVGEVDDDDDDSWRKKRTASADDRRASVSDRGRGQSSWYRCRYRNHWLRSCCILHSTRSPWLRSSVSPVIRRVSYRRMSSRSSTASLSLWGW